LCCGVVTEAARKLVLSLIRELQQQGVQGVILGCTELGGVAPQQSSPVPLFDSARLHALKAVDLALSAA
ncbi:MAG: aspartate/glutamate racemase family protein, partial [Limisphaerales bacterium]